MIRWAEELLKSALIWRADSAQWLPQSRYSLKVIHYLAFKNLILIHFDKRAIDAGGYTEDIISRNPFLMSTFLSGPT